MKRVVALVQLLVLAGMEYGAVWVLRASDVPRWSVPWGDVWAWMDRSPPADVGVALGRQVAIVLCGWLILSTALHLLATVTRVPALMRATGALTLPAIRRVVGQAATVGVTASLLVSRPAMAHDMPTGGWSDSPVAVQSAEPWTDPAVEPTPESPGSWVVAPGDNLWTISEATVAHHQGIDQGDVRCADTAVYWERLIEVNTIRSGDPDLIYAGERLVLPPPVVTPAGEPEVVADPVPPQRSATTASPVAEVPEPTPSPPEPPATSLPVIEDEAEPDTVPEVGEVDTPPASSMVTTTTVSEAPIDEAPETEPTASVTRVDTARIAGFGVLAAGVLALVLSRRRRRVQHLEPGGIEPEPDPEAAAVEIAVRAGANANGVDALVSALSTLGALVPSAVPLGAVLTDEVEIVLAESADLPRPFAGHGRRWKLTGDPVDGAFPAPASVAFGRNPSGAEIVVDLEQAGLASITGQGSVDVVRAIGLSAATAPWAESADVILVGFEDPPDLAHVRSVASLDSVIAELEDRASEVAVAVTQAGCGLTYEARAQGVAADAWTPTVVVCLSPLPDPLARRLVDVCASADAAGVAAVCAGEVPGAPWALTIRNGSLSIPGFAEGVTVPVSVTAPTLSAVRRLLESTENPPVSAVRVETPEPRGEIVVSVLGTPGVDGVHFERRKSLEALAFLAVNREREVDGDLLAEMLWPGTPRESGQRSLHQAMRGLRNTLGDGPDGEPLVPKLRGGERFYRLSPHICTSLDKLRHAVSRAASSDPDEAASLLTDALAWVRGEPFATTSEWGWARVGPEGEARSLCIEAASRLARIERDRGDLDRARWAVRQGLKACPGCEPLYALDMELHASDPDAVNRLYRELADTTPDELSESTIALHRELTRT